MRLKSIVASAAAALMVGVGIVGVGTATANPGKTIALGDSFMANPDIPAYLLSQVATEGMDLPDNVGTEGCGRDAHGIPQRLGELTGNTIVDYSCPGAVMAAEFHPNNIQGQVDRAIAENQIADATEVIIMAGFNDSYKEMDMGVALADPAASTDWGRKTTVSVGAAEHAVNTLRQAGFDGEVKFVGYPQITEPGTDNICPANVVPGAQTRIPFAAATAMENWSNDMLTRAAANTGGQFVNIAAQTQGNHMCASDADRYVTGVIDTTNTGAQFPLHLTHTANQAIAQMIKDA